MEEASSATSQALSQRDASATLPVPHAGGRPATPIAHDPNIPTVPGYVIQREIGRGGMGVVYRARHVQLNRPVALKMILSGIHAGKATVSRFWNEAQTVAKLHHPGIVQVYDYGVHKGLPYCALELTTGGSLADRTRGQLWAPRTAAGLVLQLARTIHAAHQAGVVHRDLKPANVLFTSEGQPKITDFGIAKNIGDENNSATLTGEILGTPNYMAPEQAGGGSKGVGPAADVYALGVILYEQLTGQVPFIGQDRLDILTRVRTMEPVSPRRRVPSVPVDLDVICLKCLEKDPAKRYATAEALADDLERFLSDRPVLARRPGLLERTIRWRRRNPQIAALLAAMATLFIAAFIIVAWSNIKTQEALREEGIQKREAERREKQERWERYRANIIAASSALQIPNVGAAKRALEAAPDEYRGWEWRHLNSRLDQSSLKLVGHETAVSLASLAPQSDVALFLAKDSSVSLWDARRRKRLAFQSGFQTQIAPWLSSEGNWLIRFRDDEAVELWNTNSWTFRTLRGSNKKKAHSASFSGDGRRVATASFDGVVCVWDTATCAKLFDRKLQSGSLVVTDLDRTGDRMAVVRSEGKSVQLWRLDGSKPYAELSGHGAIVTYGRFSPRMDRFFTLEHYPEYVGRLWNPETGRVISVLRGHVNEVVTFAFSNDGRRLATGSMDQTARVWDLEDGRNVSVLKGHAGRILNVAFNGDGSRVATASQDHTVGIWEAATGNRLSVLNGHADQVNSVRFLDGSRLVSASTDGTFRYWDAESVLRDGVLRGHASYVYSSKFDSTGDRLATCSWDGAAKIWDLKKGKEVRTLPHGDKTIVASVAWSPDGRHAATIVRDGTIRWWNVETGVVERQWRVPNSTWRDTRIAVSPDGSLLAVGGEKDQIHLFAVKSGAEKAVLGGKGGFTREVAFSPDGTMLASAVEDGVNVLRVWNLADLTLRYEATGHDDGVYAVAFSRDSKLIATGSIDGTARLWDASTGESLTSLPHGGNVYAVCFSPDGRRLACGAANGAVHLWDVGTGQQVAELHGHSAYIHGLDFSPDGARLATASGDFTARVWTAEENPPDSSVAE